MRESANCIGRAAEAAGCDNSPDGLTTLGCHSLTLCASERLGSVCPPGYIYPSKFSKLLRTPRLSSAAHFPPSPASDHSISSVLLREFIQEFPSWVVSSSCSAPSPSLLSSSQQCVRRHCVSQPCPADRSSIGHTAPTNTFDYIVVGTIRFLPVYPCAPRADHLAQVEAPPASSSPPGCLRTRARLWHSSRLATTM